MRMAFLVPIRSCIFFAKHGILEYLLLAVIVCIHSKKVHAMDQTSIEALIVPNTSVVAVDTLIPVHSTFLGSGSHSPSPIQDDALDPLSICPGGQVNVIFCPSRAGSS